jgi:dienelactone hydrolase
MGTLINLSLKTDDGRPLMHKYYRQREQPQGLLIGLPGGHYGVDGPLLYYPSELLREEGWDSLVLTYGYVTAGQELSLETAPALLSECQAALTRVLSERAYPRLGLVGKSLGAGVVAYLCRQMAELAEARAAYLTPVLGSAFFDDVFAETRQPAYVAVGTKDRYYDHQALEDLQTSRSFALTRVEGADHSMDVRGDLRASLAAVERVVSETLAFLKC